MTDENIFTSLEKDTKEEDTNQDENTTTFENFINGLPDWDLEPLYETIKRGDS